MKAKKSRKNNVTKIAEAAMDKANPTSCATNGPIHVVESRTPTPYDRRLTLVSRISYYESLCDSLSERFDSARLDLASARNELRDVNREIRSELSLDQAR